MGEVIEYRGQEDEIDEIVVDSKKWKMQINKFIEKITLFIGKMINIPELYNSHFMRNDYKCWFYEYQLLLLQTNK